MTILQFKKKSWSPFNHALRNALVRESIERGCGVTDLLKEAKASTKYPPPLETPFKVHAAISSQFPAEVDQFLEQNKGKINLSSRLDVDNMYYLHVLGLIGCDYGVPLTEPEKK